MEGVEKKLDKANELLEKITNKSFGGGGSGGHTTPYQDQLGRPSYVVKGFDPGADLTTDISTPGVIIETDGVRTLTTTITSTEITEVWS